MTSTLKPLELATHYLLKNNEFYAHFLLNSRIIIDDPILQGHRVGVTMDGNGPIYHFSSTFLNSTPTDQLSGTIEHETLHLLLLHLFTPQYSPTHNIAMDCAINQYIEILPNNCVTLEQFNKTYNVKAEPLQTWEYYYSLIPMDQKSQKLSISTFDLHIPMSIPSQQAEILIQAIKNASLAQTKTGTISAELFKILSDNVAPAQLPWRSLINNWVGRMTSSVSRFTRKKPNRRFGLIHPGTTTKPQLHLAFIMDTSGSMGDKMLELGFNEINRLTKYCSQITIIDADAAVLSAARLKGGRKPKRERRGSGGTAYQPAISKALELGVDAIVYFGDFDCSDTPINPNKPFLWIGTTDQKPPGDWGSVVRVR
jgi:predicted metal-dependent peptidase